jgi:hypothetical protein
MNAEQEPCTRCDTHHHRIVKFHGKTGTIRVCGPCLDEAAQIMPLTLDANRDLTPEVERGFVQ